ncbi:ABC transporter ATP-binding protein [Veillonella sp.]|uniref:ABC transporter ATP-binding protein n=1 Tax=Veillonella sp. TaxID=1926307 RepID=UPI0025FDA2FB|nr:ABC transporter ATP-binding protein [Veillonella sp.]
MNILTTKDLVFQNMIYYPDIALPKGSMTFLQGPSGCGKSTLFRLFNGTLDPSQGSIYFEGTDIATMDTLALRRKVLLVNQQVFLFDGSIEDNFKQFHAYRNTLAPDEKAMNMYLHIAATPFTTKQEVKRLSGGERQRVFNAIMLSFDADLYMWDEPSAALDTPTAITFFSRMKAYMNKLGKTTLVISHDDNLYPQFNDQLIVLEGRYDVTETTEAYHD